MIEQENIVAERLADFKKVLTYHLVNKIKYHTNGNYSLFYEIPKMWMKFKNGEQILAGVKNSDLRNTKYNPFKLIAQFNDASLNRTQVQAIFGKYRGNSSKFVPYGSAIESDPDIEVKNHGAHKSGGRTIHHANVYLLKFDLIKEIFENEDLLKRVSDATSDYYTDRQRKMIFKQITKKNHHYKTNQQIADEIDENQKIEDLIKEI